MWHNLWSNMGACPCAWRRTSEEDEDVAGQVLAVDVDSCPDGGAHVVRCRLLQKVHLTPGMTVSMIQTVLNIE